MHKKIYPFVPAILLIFFVYILSQSADINAMKIWISSTGVFAPFLIIILTLIASVFAPLSGTPILLVGYYLYGSNVIFLVTIAALISHIVNFWIARRWGRPLISKIVGKQNISKIDRFTQSYGVVSLFLSRIFLGSFHDFISYAAGLTSIKFRTYYLTSLVAAIPGTLLWYLIALRTDNAIAFVVATTIMGAILVVIFTVGKKVIRN